ncbi:glycosyl hydrolase-related protein [Cohnella sp. JJ-181]|uniref:glycoside hydrolase family 38 N-terminal domain-containing protein n=1 Tax=Cohnella rhizoplanae TaxID=2974897 RepID=UPI0022FF85F4|nr:glycosyl hydrolase-related protein [Cohnella sp. JJ-181]CAI6081212.1 Mannosylglycerate hydrolase [Cohnella sp. JJ-181]
MKKTYHFISHTHWDREWYLPLERFRYRLVNLIDRLLDLLDRESEFRCFHLDGQTIVLEDYYTLRPGNKERLERFIRAGRILVGPWYQQNDLYLTSAESTVRNLAIGIGLSRELGGEMKVGYLPDHFGLIGQMPQIFRGVGIDNCVFGRGYDIASHRGPFFVWAAPDGSRVSGVLMPHWYNNAQRLPAEPEALAEMFAVIRAREEKVNATPHLLMMNGVDHLEAQYDLPEVLQQLRDNHGDELDIVHGTLPGFVQALQGYINSQSPNAYETVTGELRECMEYSVLAGTLSSRVYIKKANMEVHDLLEKWMEPLSVWCAMLGLDAYEHDTLRYAWKLYMENHPHDSICGCSQDAVHDHMMDRYARLGELAEEVIDRKLSVLARQLDGASFGDADLKLLVANTAQLAAGSVIGTTVYFMEDDDIEDFALLDAAGREIPYRIVSEQRTRRQVISPVNLPGVQRLKRFDIEWRAEAPALGYAAYVVRPGMRGLRAGDRTEADRSAVAAANGPTAPAGLPVLENEWLRVELQADGSFHLLDKENGMLRRHQGRFEDAGDRGDLYVFLDTEGERSSEIWSQAVTFESAESNVLYDACVYSFVWALPASLNDDMLTRSETTAPCEFRVRLRLDRGARQLNIQIELDNTAKDHRIRMVFEAERSAESVWSGGQYDVVERAWDDGRQWLRHANSQPFWKWFAPVAEGAGLAVFAKGLHEYEMKDEGRTAVVTLVRGVENINMRETVSMEQDIQPKGQCLGRQTAELAVRPFVAAGKPGTAEAGRIASRLYKEAELYHQGVRTKLSPVDERRWSRGRAWVQDTHFNGGFAEIDPNRGKPALPLEQSVMSIAGDAVLSAVKASEDRTGYALRMFNTEAGAVRIGIGLPADIAHAVRTNLLEEPAAALEAVSSGISLEAGPKEIVTVCMTLNEAGKNRREREGNEGELSN